MKNKRIENNAQDSPVVYAIWAEGKEDGPLPGRCGYLSEFGKRLFYTVKSAAERKIRDIELQRMCKGIVANFHCEEYIKEKDRKRAFAYEKIKKHHLRPEFDPTEFEVKSQAYGNTGGGCMVGTISVYIPSLDKTVWVNCNDEGITITSTDYLWNDDGSESWDRYEDVKIFSEDFRGHRPEEFGAWLPMVYEALIYTIERQIDDGRRFTIPTAWLPDRYRQDIAPDILAEALKYDIDVTIKPGGKIEFFEEHQEDSYCQADPSMSELC